MAIVRRTATVVEHDATTSSITAELPADMVAGDYVLATFVMSCTLVQFTPPDGSWTAAFSPFFVNDNNVLAAYWKFSPASAPSASASVNGRQSVITEAWGGVHATNPIDVAAAVATTSPYGSSLAVGGITTVSDNTELVSAAVVDSSSAVLTHPTGMTSIGDASGGGVGRGLEVAVEAKATAGATGTRTWNQGGGSLGMGAYLLALRPTSGIQATGSITGTGALTKSTLKTFTGSSTATSVLTALKVVAKAFDGAITATGALLKAMPKTFTGSSTATGALGKVMPKVFTGSSTPAGSYSKAFVRIFTGSITGAGSFAYTLLGRVFGRPGIITTTVQKAGEVILRIRRT